MADNPFEKVAKKATEKAPTDQSVTEEVPISQLFDELRQRVDSDAAKALILKAKSEFNELSSRVGDIEARSLVSKLVTDRIQSQLNAAEKNG